MSNEFHQDEISAINSDASKIAESNAKGNIKHVRQINDGDVSKFKRLNPIWFSYQDSRNSSLVPGFYAEDIAAVYPSVAIYDDDNAIDWSEKNLIPFMVRAIQKCQRQINELEKEIKDLKKNMKD